MIQLRLVLFGVSVVASIGYAIYRHYSERSQQQPHSYGPQNDDNIPTMPATSNSSEVVGTRKRRKSPTSSNCSICLVDVLRSAANSRILNCGHFFHDRCIETWFNMNQKTCPNCRALV